MYETFGITHHNFVDLSLILNFFYLAVFRTAFKVYNRLNVKVVQLQMIILPNCSAYLVGFYFFYTHSFSLGSIIL